MQIKISLRNVLLFAGLMLVKNLPADTIYSTLGPPPYTSNAQHFTVGGFYVGPSSGGIGLAAPFSFSGTAYQLDSVTVDIGLDTIERAANLQIGIFADAGGRPSSTAIAVLEPNPSLVTTFFDRRLTTYSWLGQTILDPNAAYWIAFQPHTVGVPTDEYDVLYRISSSILPPTLPVARRDFGAGWAEWTVFQNHLQPAFSLNGTAVPEPSTWALLALGSLALGSAARRRRK